MVVYKGYTIDEDTSDQSVTVLDAELKEVYVTGNYGRAKSFIDGLTHGQVFEDLEERVVVFVS